jgi:AraC-like DNA-binding protein
MIFTLEDRLSDSSFVERIWRAQSERAGDLLSIAMSHWEMVVSRYQDKTYMTVRGPETKATPLPVTIVGTEFFGIRFKLGTVMPYLPASTLVDGDVDLPDASSKSFWLNGSAWQFPSYENADTFVDRLVRQDLLVRDPIVESALQGQLKDLSIRTARRHFLRTTGLTQKAIRQIERARYATVLLQQGMSILDVVYEAGYYDQPHLTRSLKHFIGLTPTQIMQKNRPEQLSLLYKTERLR